MVILVVTFVTAAAHDRDGHLGLAVVFLDLDLNLFFYACFIFFLVLVLLRGRGDALDLRARTEGDAIAGTQGAARRLLVEERHVFLVHVGPLADIGHEHGALDHVVHACAGAFQGRLDILERLPGLGADATLNELARGRIDAQLAAQEDEVVVDHGLGEGQVAHAAGGRHVHQFVGAGGLQRQGG
jgi:hypothetical protein